MRSSRPAGPSSGAPQAPARSPDKRSLVEQQSPATAGSLSTAAATPSSASSNPALAASAAANPSNDRSSFDTRPPPTPQQQQHLQQSIHDDQPTPPLQDYTHSSAKGQQQHLVQRPAADPASAYDPDSVSRSQSHRYPPHAAGNPQPYPLAATSVEDFRRQSQLVSPLLPQAQVQVQAQILPPLPLQQQQQQQLPPPAAVPEPPQKHSKRNILNKVFNRGSHRSEQSITKGDGSSTSNTLRRKESTRHTVGSPPAIRTGPSQVSLEQHPTDWQQAPAQPTQPSPLQGVGEFTPDPTYRSLSNQDLLQQGHNSQDPQHPTIRPVQPDSDPHYSAEDLQYQQIAQTQGDQQQYRYSQVVYDAGQQPQTQYQSPHQPQYPAGGQLQFLGQLSTSQHQNPETISQLSHESPINDQDQRSANNHSAQASPVVAYSHQAQDLQQPSQQTSQQHPPPTPQSAMPNSQRRQQEMDEALRGQVDPQLGAPPAYRQHNRPQPQGNNNMNPLPPPPPNSTGQPPNYRPDQRQFEGVQEQQRAGDHGRNSPQPAPAEPTAAQEKTEMKELVTKYKNVKRLYFDGKNQIEQLSTQIEQLQNAIANQRMSQSRTMLDDNEYNKLFDRLGGAINNLSFNIRKDWRALPQWVDRVVSPDALKTGKQEMTAVGRAIITHWVMEEIFNKCFHPGLDPELSSSLKEIERNIRLFSSTMNMREEHDALTSKIVSWRMTTLEGLDRRLNSPGSKENYTAFTEKSTANLTIYLNQFMADPPPTGIEGSVSMIIELAIKIASNIPLESRDLAITYPLPGDQIHKDLMEVEKTPLPPLPGGDGPGDDASSVHEDKEGKGSRPQGSKPGMLTKLGPAGLGRKGSTASSITMPTDATVPTAPPLPKDPTKVRLAGFVAVEVRGKHTLIKAPVWTLG